MKHAARRALFAALALTGAGAVVYALMPGPVPVETGRADRGTVRVTVSEDGRTRVKERYVVSSPLAGRMERPVLEEGDAIEAGQTVLAVIDPVDPALLDPRARAEAEARVRAAEAALEQSQSAMAKADAALEFAQGELKRQEIAAAAHGVQPRELEQARLDLSLRREEARAAGFAREIAVFELDLARAALLRSAPDGGADAEWRFEIRAPISGRVLRVVQESASVVAPGTPIVEVGDPADLEIVVDVLSSDAVRIAPGAPVSVERWGGEAALRAAVRLVEPSAFTKISALGVEEQRVNVVADFTDPPQRRAGLGDGFRVECTIVVEEAAGVLRVPVAALFRRGPEWGTFAVEDGRAVLRTLDVGRMNSEYAEVLAGLEEGAAVVVFPSDRVRDGANVRERTK